LEEKKLASLLLLLWLRLKEKSPATTSIRCEAVYLAICTRQSILWWQYVWWYYCILCCVLDETIGSWTWRRSTLCSCQFRGKMLVLFQPLVSSLRSVYWTYSCSELR
jgi:hypothetical protein